MARVVKMSASTTRQFVVPVKLRVLYFCDKNTILHSPFLNKLQAWPLVRGVSRMFYIFHVASSSEDCTCNIRGRMYVLLLSLCIDTCVSYNTALDKIVS